METAPEADAVPIETHAAQGEAAETQQTADMSVETLETEPNIEPPAGESDTIKDSRQGTEGRRPEEPSEEGKEG